MSEELRSLVLGTVGLDALVLLALGMTRARGRVATGPGERAGVARIAVLALALQAAHFGEEWWTGFYRRFPELLGLVPWPVSFFVGLNLFWLAAWVLAIVGLGRPAPAVAFALWFLALGGIANVVAHPLLSLAVGGYFPGLVTAPLVGVGGFLLLRRMLDASGRLQPSPEPARAG